MGQSEQNCRCTKSFVDGTGDIVQTVRRVIECVAVRARMAATPAITDARHAPL